MKKILLLLCSFGAIVYLSAPFLRKNDVFEAKIEAVLNGRNETVNTYKELEFDLTEFRVEEALQKIEKISAINDKEQWFIFYKQICKEYSDVLDPPLSIYDFYTDEEIYLIQRVVETECYDQSFESKTNVASVALNRIDVGGEFGYSVGEVITKENQFAYWRTELTESTILAVEYSFEIEDTTDGCVGFRSDDYPKVWHGWELSFIDEAKHGFYKEKGGIGDG